MIHDAIAAHHRVGSMLGTPHFLTMLAVLHADAGDLDAGCRYIEEALARAARTGDRVSEPDVHRVHGDLLLRRAAAGGGGRVRAEAERSLRKAMRLARRRAGRSHELRAATSLARLWQSRGERERARRLLAPLYRRFTEGADTADVTAARQLLEA